MCNLTLACKARCLHCTSSGTMSGDSQTDWHFLPKFFLPKCQRIQTGLSLRPDWGTKSLTASAPPNQLLQDVVPGRFVQHTSDCVISQMSLFPVSEAYNPLSLAWKGSFFCVHLQCLINFLQCTCHSSCWDIWEVNQYKMAVLCLSWKGKLLPSIAGFLPCWTNIHNPELTYCRCKHHCASLVGSLPQVPRFWGLSPPRYGSRSHCLSPSNQDNNYRQWIWS